MTYTRKNVGVCSSSTTVEIEDGVIKSCSVAGGCNGNLNGICSLMVGLTPEHVIERFEGVKCGFKNTSCPDQIAQCLKEAVAK